MAKRTDDDNFYSQMAADFDSDSDVSDADPVEMSKKLANLDDLDAGLFTPREKKAVETKPKPVISTTNKAKQSFDDLDDDLADAIDDILGDDSGLKTGTSSKFGKKVEDDPAAEGGGTAFTDSEDSATEDKKPTINLKSNVVEAPTKPAVTTKIEPKKEKSAVSFSSDEDDLLPEQNLSKTAPAAPSTTPKPATAPRRRSAGPLDDDDEEENRPARSALSSLLSKPKAVADLEKPVERKEFSLDAKYTSPANKGDKKGATQEGDDDFWGSSYRPSTASNRPTRRSVHFEDEAEFGLSKRPDTAPNKSGAADWLGLGDDIDFTTPPKSRHDDPLSQTAPVSMKKPEADGDKFVSRFEMAETKKSPAASDNSYLDLGQEVDLDSIIASKKSQKSTPEPTSPKRLENSPKISSSDNLPSSSLKQDFQFDVDLGSTPKTSSRPPRRRRTSSGSSKSVSPDRAGFASSSIQSVPDKPPSGRHLAELFKSEREESMQAAFQHTQLQQQEIMRKQQEAMQAQVGRSFIPQLPNISAMSADSTIVLELENKIKKMEMEKEHINSMMDLLKRRHNDELQLMEESHKNKMQIMEESYQRREQRYREENALLSEQSLEKSKAVERERSEMQSEIKRRTDDVEREKSREMSRMRDAHREEMDALRREHAQMLDGIRLARQQEYEAMRDAQPTARSIQTVIDQLSSSTKDLSSLQSRVDSGHSSNREEKEVFLRARDEQLRTLEDRLRRQEEDTQRERERLQDLVSKMDVQLREQTRLMEEEKWKTKQESNRLSAQQTAMDEERRTLMEQMRREREAVEKAKSAVLAEQKQLLAQLFDERKVLAEERVQFNLQQNEWMEKQQKSSVRVVQNEADLEGQLRVTQEEKRRVASLEAELREARESVRRDKMALERERATLEGERARLEAMESDIRRREHALEEREEECERLRRSGDAAFFSAKQTEEEQQQRLNSIASQQGQLRSKEKQLTQDRLQIARQREELEKMRDSILCVSCRVPVRDIPVLHNPMRSSSASPMSPLSRFGVAENSDPMAFRAIRRSQEVAQAMEADRTLRMIQLEAEKDQEFLQGEKAFLDSLKRASYQTGV